MTFKTRFLLVVVRNIYKNERKYYEEMVLCSRNNLMVGNKLLIMLMSKGILLSMIYILALALPLPPTRPVCTRTENDPI